MHVLVVTFHLEGLSEADYLGACKQLAPAIAEAPGLIGKTFIANAENNTYGGVYFWRDQASLDAFKQSDVWQAVATNQALVGTVAQEFGVLEEPSRVTRGVAAVAA